MRSNDVRRYLTLALLVAGATAAAIGVGRLVTVGVVAGLVVLLLVVHRGALPAVGGASAPVRQAVVQAWWAPIAALLGVATILAGVGTIAEAHNLGGRIVGSGVLLLFGTSTIWGLLRRPRNRQAGDALILVGTLPAFPFFWLVVPAVAALAVWVGVCTAGPVRLPAGDVPV